MAAPRRLEALRFHDRDEPKLIRGQIIGATVALYEGSQLIAAGEIDPKNFPAQFNNGGNWLRAMRLTLGNKSIPFFTRDPSKFVLTINGGQGVQRGRGSNDNVIEFKVYREDGILEWRAVLSVQSENYIKSYYERRAQGLPVRPQTNYSKSTYFDARANQVMRYIPEEQTHLVYSPEEYFQEFPQDRGLLPIKKH